MCSGVGGEYGRRAVTVVKQANANKHIGTDFMVVWSD